MNPNIKWPLAIIGLIGMNMSIVGVTVYYAWSDASVAVEPDYYQKALRWDDTASKSRHSAALGWTATLTLEAPGRAVLVLRDAAGAPVEADRVTAIYFHNARSGDRHEAHFAPVSGEPGSFVAPVRLPREGIYRVRLSAARGSDEFFIERDCSFTHTP